MIPRKFWLGSEDSGGSRLRLDRATRRASATRGFVLLAVRVLVGVLMPWTEADEVRAAEQTGVAAPASQRTVDEPHGELAAMDLASFSRWRDLQRGQVRKMLGISDQRVPLDAEPRGQVQWDGVVLEKWVFTSEPGSRVPAVLYRPQEPAGKMPAIVLTFGHGGSKSSWQYNYAGLLYARLGIACLAIDPLGEEERHCQGRMGTRAHDPEPVSSHADAAGRLIMGKLVFDTMRGIDWLLERDDIAHDRIGVAGNSLGGAKAGWMVAVEPRIKMAIVSGWAYDDVLLHAGKLCTNLPNQRVREFLTWGEYAALGAPDCAVLIMNGDADRIIDQPGDGRVWKGTRQAVEQAAKVYAALGAEGKIQAWFEPEGGHRPYFVYREALEWIHQQLGTPAMTLAQIRELPTVNSGEWCDVHGIHLERLYGTRLHQRGATLPDLRLRPTPRDLLACLEPGELGSPAFTLEGWLRRIARPDYLALVRAYADALIERGRDVYGDQHSPLFAAALDRTTMRLGSREHFGSIPGVREHDRSLGGANPQEDKALYGILYELTALTGEKRYAAEADRALEFFFTRCQSPETGLMAWGEHLYWDFHAEACGGNDQHEILGTWPYWDACYRLAPEASWRFAIGQWDHQIACQQTGDFSRHARWSKHGPGREFDFPRYAGQMIVNWADAYVRQENAGRPRREELLTAIAVVAGRMEENSELTKTGYLPAGRAAAGSHIDVVWAGSNLQLARCVWEAAEQIEPEHGELAARLRQLALRQDADFHKMPHQIASGGGFAATLDSTTGEPRARGSNQPFTELWATGYGYGIHAGLANQCYARSEQLAASRPELAAPYRALVLAAADQYLSATPAPDELQKPGALSSVIQLMLHAHQMTRQQKYLDRAEHLARVGVGMFLDAESPLPKATNRHAHYEALTGGTDFMQASLQLAIALNNAAGEKR
jgi:dienelactone hydrolase